MNKAQLTEKRTKRTQMKQNKHKEEAEGKRLTKQMEDNKKKEAGKRERIQKKKEEAEQLQPITCGRQ